MRQKRIWIAAVIVLAVLFVFGICTYDSFRHKGIDHALVGQVEEDRYPDWDSWNDSEKVSDMEYDIVSKRGLLISKIYLIERANHYQERLRVAAGMPFRHPDLIKDTDWILQDSEGNSYTGNLVVYSEQIAGLNCVNITLVLDGEEFSNLSGKELSLTAVCSKERNDKASIENSYAHCEVKIEFL